MLTVLVEFLKNFGHVTTLDAILNDCVFIADVQDVEFRVETFLPESFQGGVTPALVSGGEVDISLELLTERPHYGEAYSLVGPSDDSDGHCE